MRGHITEFGDPADRFLPGEVRRKFEYIACVTLARMGRNFLLTVVAACLITASSIVLYVRLNDATPHYLVDNKIKILDAITHWENLIAELGPELAHDEMVREAFTIPESQRHILTHAFGEALYNAGDLGNITYCAGGEFLFGCYHQFIGLATIQFGSSIIHTLKDACETGHTPVNCAHGIGHGLLSTYGYSMNGVEKSLAECHSFYDEKEERGICADGIFMEYNLQEITTLEQNRIPRTFSSDRAPEPCFSIGREFRDECVYELPLWWHLALSATSTVKDLSTFPTMGNLCRAIPSSHEQKVCFIGIGFPGAQFSRFDAASVSKACHLASESETEYMLCASGAAKRYVENGIENENVCAELQLTGNGKLYCEKFKVLPRKDGYALDAS